jgi:glycine/D-amino acid oxidase-like deaminating enzyme
MTSLWLEEDAEPFAASNPNGPVDVAIVGGGVTGCSSAPTLALGGLRVRVHEARQIASGASGRNGGFALRGSALSYAVARERLGADQAAALWRLTERSLDRMAELAGDAFRRVGSLKLAADEAELDELRAEYEALGKDGFDVDWVDDLGPPPCPAVPGRASSPDRRGAPAGALGAPARGGGAGGRRGARGTESRRVTERARGGARRHRHRRLHRRSSAAARRGDRARAAARWS